VRIDLFDPHTSLTSRVKARQNASIWRIYYYYVLADQLQFSSQIYVELFAATIFQVHSPRIAPMVPIAGKSQKNNCCQSP
jgi:hypothetical protein